MKSTRFYIILPPILVCLCTIFIPVLSYSIGEEESLMEVQNEKGLNFSFGRKNTKRKQASIVKKKYVPKGNLPPILIRKKSSISMAKRKNPIQFPELSPINKSGMDVGDILDCMITQDIKAYVGSVSPIRAEVLTGEKKGLIFIGNATMDPKTKNIIIEFNLARDLRENRKHKLKATLHSSTGELGLKGTFHSKYWQYFFATVLSRSAEGYAQASVQRDRNIFGNYQEVPNPQNAGKSAVAEAASSTADLVADRMKNMPEYITKKGPIRTKIFIIETPKLIN